VLCRNLCNAYAQLGARGVSILFSSGDGGVAGSHSKQTCTTFVPTFPSGCPYITVVGATAGAPTETAADFSSSGFSNIFPVPDFQKGAMSAYLGKIGSTNQGLYNAVRAAHPRRSRLVLTTVRRQGGRGFPDVSATGEQIPIVSGGQTQAVQGTSASTPIFASVVALLNDRRLAAGQQPLGWLNPWLYNNTAMLNDITSGERGESLLEDAVAEARDRKQRGMQRAPRLPGGARVGRGMSVQDRSSPHCSRVAGDRARHSQLGQDGPGGRCQRIS
jgi:tripeptidyl-peptidase-1